MARPSFIKNPKPQSITLEKEEYDELLTYIGRKPFSEFVRDLIKTEIENRRVVGSDGKLACLSSEIKETENDYLNNAVNVILDTQDPDFVDFLQSTSAEKLGRFSNRFSTLGKFAMSLYQEKATREDRMSNEDFEILKEKVNRVNQRKHGRNLTQEEQEDSQLFREELRRRGQ